MTPKQEEALREWLQEAIVPLIEQVLVKKLGQAMSYAATELVQPKRTWVGLTDEEIRKAWSQALADTEGEHYLPLNDFASLLQAKLKEKNT